MLVGYESDRRSASDEVEEEDAHEGAEVQGPHCVAGGNDNELVVSKKSRSSRKSRGFESVGH